jgi:hypothetical protein
MRIRTATVAVTPLSIFSNVQHRRDNVGRADNAGGKSPTARGTMENAKHQTI